MDRETENRKPPWTRRRKIILFSSIGLAIVLIVAGGTLPQWLPRSVIADRIIGQIRSQTGLDVSVGDISLSWSNGVRISDLRISSPASFGGGQMVHIGAIRTEFSPWRMATGKKISWVELDDPRVALAVNANGDINAAALSKLDSDLHIGRITVRRAVASLKIPDKERLLSVNVGELELVQGRPDRIGKITMSADLQQSGENAPVKLSIRPGGGADAVDARIDFANINLQELQIEKIARLPISKLSGMCSGFVELNVTRQAKVEHFAVDVAIKQLLAVPQDAPPLPVIDNAGFALTASYDPITGLLDMQSAKVQLPGLSVTGKMSAHADLLESSWKSIESLQVDGIVQPDEISLLMTGRPEFSGGMRIAGPVQLSGDFQYAESQLALKTRIDAGRAVISSGGKVIKPFGVKCGADVDGSVDDRSWSLKVVRNKIEFGDNLFSGTGELSDCRAMIAQLFPSRQSGKGGGMTFSQAADRVLSKLAWKGDMTISDVAPLRQAFGQFDAAMKDVSLATPLSGSCMFDGPGGCRFSGKLSLPARGVLKVGQLSADLSRWPVSAETTFKVNAKSPGISELSAHMVVGKAKFAVADFDISSGDESDVSLSTTGNFKVQNIGDIISLPGLTLPDGLKFSGDVSGKCGLKFDRQFRPRGQIDLDVSALGLDCGDAILLPAGELKTLGVALSPSEYPTVRLAGDSSLGKISCDIDVLDLRTRRFGADLRVAVNIDKVLSVSKLARQSLGQVKLSGSADIAVRATIAGDSADCDLLADCGKTAVSVSQIVGAEQLGELKKDSDVPAKLTAAFAIAGGKSLTVRSVAANVGSVGVKFDGQATAATGADGKPVVELNKWRTELTLADVSELVKFAPVLDAFKPAGTIDLEVSGQGVEQLDGRATLKDVKFAFKGLVPEVKGQAEFSVIADKSSPIGVTCKFNADGLEFRADKTHGWLVADISALPASPTGKCYILFDNIDEKFLTDHLAPTETAPASSPAGHDEDALAAIRKSAADIVAMGRKALASADLKISLYAQKSNVFDKSVGQCYPMLNRQVEIDIARGKINLQIDGGLNGGTMSVRIATDLNDANPKLSYDSKLRHVIATDSIQPQLAKYFPGNIVHDSFDRSESVVYPLNDFVASIMDPRCKPPAVGKGMMVAQKGTLIGRAAPYFVTNIFPGLNMAKYDYLTMTCFSTYLPDGTAENDMIFCGDIYDVYIEGTTSAEHIGEYQMGLVLGGQGAYWNHEWKQLRFPLLKFKGRIEGGKILDQEVSYHWPTETAFIVLLQNNAAYRLWLNKKARNEQAHQKTHMSPEQLQRQPASSQTPATSKSEG